MQLFDMLGAPVREAIAAADAWHRLALAEGLDARQARGDVLNRLVRMARHDAPAALAECRRLVKLAGEALDSVPDPEPDPEPEPGEIDS
jgi:hypothetical protein